jgi:hypothetical protein
MYRKKCDYCHEDVSVFESVTEYGKHYHESCMIHKLQSEINDYKKKFLNQKMTKGDKADLVDKYQLCQTLMSERTEFKGWKMIQETSRSTRKTIERVALSDSNGFLIVDPNGKPVLIEEEGPSVEITYAKMRPDIVRTKLPVSKNLLKTAEEILQISAPISELPESKHNIEEGNQDSSRDSQAYSTIECNSVLASCMKALKPSQAPAEVDKVKS